MDAEATNNNSSDSPNWPILTSLIPYVDTFTKNTLDDQSCSLCSKFKDIQEVFDMFKRYEQYLDSIKERLNILRLICQEKDSTQLPRLADIMQDYHKLGTQCISYQVNRLPIPPNLQLKATNFKKFANELFQLELLGGEVIFYLRSLACHCSCGKHREILPPAVNPTLASDNSI